MTVKELIAELQALPPNAPIVFRHNREDAPPCYETVDCWYDRDDDEAYVDIHGDDDDE